MKPSLLKSQSGFSLIELMTVVAIIAILSSVAIPNYQYFVDKARIIRVKSEVGDLATSAKALNALYNFYPNTNTAWFAALTYAL